MENELGYAKGWGWPLLSKKAHFFEGGHSLCNKWRFTGKLEHGNNDSPDNCKTCIKKFNARKEELSHV